MPLPQDHIGRDTPMGANVAPGGATVRVWAPRARAVHMCHDGHWEPDDENLLVRGPDGHWTGFVVGLLDGMQYKFWVVGDGSTGFKRDPYARELTIDPAYPHCNCILRDPSTYPWHDAGYTPPRFHELVLYQLHVGSFFVPGPPGASGTFLDVVAKLDHLVDLGVNALQLLPVVEFPTWFSLGYNGTDLFSPEQRYAEWDPVALDRHRDAVNGRLVRSGWPLTSAQLRGPASQLKALVDVCHTRGIAVLLDVVFNHAGGDFGDESLYFFDRAQPGDNNNSLYFTDQGWAGGLVFALWNSSVRQFLIDNAQFFLEEYHVDGLRYDAMNVAVEHSSSGWQFCQDLTNTVRFLKPEAVQIAEYWPVDPWVVTNAEHGGAGFDACWQDELREALRECVAQASHGREARVDLDRVAGALRQRGGLPAAWKSVQFVESHDEVRRERRPRIPRVADSSRPTSWYARSRARVATGLLVTAPGVPMLFMGQEMLETEQWTDDLNSVADVIAWDGLESGTPAADFCRFVRALLAVRRSQPALQSEWVNVHHVHNDNRILTYHRWVEGVGRDVVVVASLAETTLEGYRVGMPRSGHWTELLNSDVYDNWVNPWVAGNGGHVWADDWPLHGMPASAALTVPANSILVLG